MTALRLVSLVSACRLLLGMGCATTGPPLEPIPAVEMPYPPTAAKVQPPGYEAPPTLPAWQVFSLDVETSAAHHMDGAVENDGFMHHVAVESAGGVA